MTETLMKFMAYKKKLDYYEHVITQLYWDMQTQTPKAGYIAKTETVTFFSTEHFALSTVKEYGDLLEALLKPEEFEQLEDAMKITVKRRKRDYDESCNLPPDFYEELVRETAYSKQAWEIGIA